MKSPSLTPESEFIVGEERVLAIVMSILFAALAIYGIIDLIRNGFNSSVILILALGPCLMYIKKYKSKRVYIRVNRKGIFQDEKLITSWPFLLNAYIDQSEGITSYKIPTIKDNFILILEYKKDDSMKGFRKSIPLTNTQDKSEEDVLAAVKYFWKLSKAK